MLLTLIGVVATLWLAADGRLGLYIHPRYFEFTVIMALLGGAAAIAALVLVPGGGSGSASGGTEPHEHEGHEHGDADAGGPPAAAGEDAGARRPGIRTLLGWLVVAGTAIALLVLPPATLTEATAAQRSVNAGAAVQGAALAEDSPALAGGDTSSLTVKDWALLVNQNPDPGFHAGKAVDVVGFVTEHPDDPDAFYLARFVVTCCAVDAQPVGLAVQLPGWAEQYEPGTWLEAQGAIGPAGADGGLRLVADRIEPVAEPEQPYVY